MKALVMPIAAETFALPAQKLSTALGFAIVYHAVWFLVPVERGVGCLRREGIEMGRVTKVRSEETA